MSALAILNTIYLLYMINCIRVIRKARNPYGVYLIKDIRMRSFFRWWGKSPASPFPGTVKTYLMDRKIHIVYSIVIYMGLIICALLVTGISALIGG